MTTPLIVGVDPGITGALAWCIDGRLSVWPMRLIDGALAALRTLDRPIRFVVEALLAVPNQSIQSTQTTARNWGRMVAKLDAVGVVEEVQPRTWQAALGLTKGRGEKGSAHKQRIRAAMERAYATTIDTVAVADAVGILYYATNKEARCVA